MPRIASSGSAPKSNGSASFTLIELLTVMAILAILLALTLALVGPLFTRADRSRATTEIAALSAALESYKTDNGTYPTASGLQTNTYASFDGTSPNYQLSSQILYRALSGQTNFTDTPLAGTKTYLSFRRNQVGTTTGGSYAQDPWGYSYAYSTGTSASPPYNGSGAFDLWSTGGSLVASSTFTNTWLQNWK